MKSKDLIIFPFYDSYFSWRFLVKISNLSDQFSIS